MGNDRTEELVAVGTWRYADAVECRIHLVRRNVAFGTGDYEHPVDVREDCEGEFYYLKFSSPADPKIIRSESGAFDSIELAKENAKAMCPRLVWNSKS